MSLLGKRWRNGPGWLQVVNLTTYQAQIIRLPSPYGQHQCCGMIFNGNRYPLFLKYSVHFFFCVHFNKWLIYCNTMSRNVDDLSLVQSLDNRCPSSLFWWMQHRVMLNIYRLFIPLELQYQLSDIVATRYRPINICPVKTTLGIYYTV